jgi:hypothetical protein
MSDGQMGIVEQMVPLVKGGGRRELPGGLEWC